MDICKPDESGSALAGTSWEEAAKSWQLPRKGPVPAGRQQWGNTRATAEPPDTASWGSSREISFNQSLSEILLPGTADLDGTEKPKRHFKGLKAVLLSSWLRAVSVQGRGKHSHGNLAHATH